MTLPRRAWRTGKSRGAVTGQVEEGGRCHRNRNGGAQQFQILQMVRKMRSSKRPLGFAQF